jgi:cytochrome P450
MQSLTPNFDPTDPAFPTTFLDLMSEQRARCPVTHVDALGGFWMVTKYADVTKAARDWKSFSSAGLGTMIPPLKSSVPVIPPSSDPPDHTAYRRILNPYFTPAAVARYESGIRAFARSLIDGFASAGECDLIAEYVEPIPSTGLALLLGLEREDWPVLRDLTRRMLSSRFAGPAVAAEMMRDFETYIDDLIARRRAAPTEDVTSAIVHGDAGDGQLDPDVVRGIVFVLIAGGHETVANGIGNLLYRLTTDEALRRQLTDQPDLIGSAVEESLRLDSPTQWLARTATADVQVGDAGVPAGERVMLVWASANRDEDAFEEADRFVCPRQPNRHVGFGFGIHRCIGEHLARLEMRIATEELLHRLPDIHARPDLAEWKYNTHARGLARLPVRFSPA